MKGKIGLEEHFAIDDTLMDSKGVLSRRHLGRGARPHPRPARPPTEADGRVRHADDDSVAERAGDPGHPRRQEGQRDRAQGQRLSRRAGAEAPGPLPGAGRAAAAGPRHGDARAGALRQANSAWSARWPTASRRSATRHDRLSRREAVLAVLGDVRPARRAVLPASAQSAAAGRAHLQGRRLAARA